MASRSETIEHARLKALALAWAQSNGFAICGLEVRVPGCGFRADVAAYARGTGPAKMARTAVFECKQARADLLKDAHAEAATRARLAELLARRKSLEDMLAVHRPDVRRGEALWPEYDSWDFDAIGHTTYRRLLLELEKVQRHVLRGTKFSRMFRYRSADFLYLVVENGIFAEAEVPAGWGLLVRNPAEAAEGLRLLRAPVHLYPAPASRTTLLENIALAGTRAANRLAGVAPPPSRRP